jgi:uncharacterized membrane protein YeaQ/YmgE (transglycosylase-associated protein family)
LQETAQNVLAYIQANLVVSLVIALIAGFAASRVVASERRPGAIGSTIIGVIGFFLGNFMLTYWGLGEYLENLHGLRIFIDLVAAFIGSFIISTLLHFLKPS